MDSLELGVPTREREQAPSVELGDLMSVVGAGEVEGIDAGRTVHEIRGIVEILPSKRAFIRAAAWIADIRVICSEECELRRWRIARPR